MARETSSAFTRQLQSKIYESLVSLPNIRKMTMEQIFESLKDNQLINQHFLTPMYGKLGMIETTKRYDALVESSATQLGADTSDWTDLSKVEYHIISKGIEALKDDCYNKKRCKVSDLYKKNGLISLVKYVFEEGKLAAADMYGDSVSDVELGDIIHNIKDKLDDIITAEGGEKEENAETSMGMAPPLY